MSSQVTGMGRDGMNAPPGPEGLIPQDEAFSSGPLLTHYLQHLLWWFREGVEPVMAVDGNAGRASVGTQTPWLQGHIGVQVFESGILAADARVRWPYPTGRAMRNITTLPMWPSR